MKLDCRADHVGSLLRPPALLEARAAFTDGKVTVEQLHEAEDVAILDALRRQKQAGVDVFTDGEFRRSVFYGNMIDAVEGFVFTEEVPLEWRGPGGDAGRAPGRAVASRLKQKHALTASELPFLQQHAPGLIKITLSSANQFRRAYRPGLTDQFYGSEAELTQDLIGIIRHEVEDLIAKGVRYIQIDAPNYTALVDSDRRARMQSQGIDPDAELARNIEIDNATVAGLHRDDVILALHMCRGNSRSRWLSEGSYEPIAERILGSLDFDRLLLEYDSERAGGFEPLRFLPKDKEVVLGLITTKEGRLEDPDELARRVEEAAQYVDMDRLGLSPQCGFASAMLGNLLSLDEQQRKLELVAQTTSRIWS